MFKIQLKDDSVQMSKEYLIDFLKKLNINHSIRKNIVTIKTAEEINDERVPVPLELEDSEKLRLMSMAHARNLSFNDFCNEVLREEIEKFEQAKQSKKTKKIKK